MNGHVYHQRLAALRDALRQEACDAFISVAPVDNAYLTGFFGSTSSLLVTATTARLLCDFRYIEQAGKQVQGGEVVLCEGSLDVRLAEQLDALTLRRVAFEPDAITVGRRDAIAAVFQGELAPRANICRQLREIKDASEIEGLQAASALAEAALEATLDQMRPGVSERDMAGLLEYEFRRRGAQGAAFDSLVQFGANSALPHGMPGDRRLQSGDIVLVDCGCVLDGYCSDLTRTFVFGRIPGSWFTDVYELVRTAQAAAVAAALPGTTAREVDAAARIPIVEAGHGDHFGHGTGHGVGLEVHEAPRLHKQSTAILRAGMVVTIEPGVYLPGQGGVRIEDLLAVTETGNRVLTTLPKKLRIL